MANSPLAAQDASGQPSLDDLIPDSAVEDPDDWAGRGTDIPSIGEFEDIDGVEPETPITDSPDFDVAWPADLPGFLLT